MNKLVNYIKVSISELKKVEWPTREQAIRHTILVIAISLVVAAFLGIVDFILTRVLQIII
ncbi:preprotein translocase subunit SecE [Candidatus Microgenomates bacterium]|nr:preprotein translocase subunit SecE [Candidatus Microgenomates bacterium]